MLVNISNKHSGLSNCPINIKKIINVGYFLKWIRKYLSYFFLTLKLIQCFLSQSLDHEIQSFCKWKTILQKCLSELSFVSKLNQQFIFQTDKQQSERNMATIHTCEIEEGDDFMLDFEQFVSEQEIFYFGTDMEFSMFTTYLFLGLRKVLFCNYT